MSDLITERRIKTHKKYNEIIIFLTIIDESEQYLPFAKTIF